CFSIGLNPARSKKSLAADKRTFSGTSSSAIILNIIFLASIASRENCCRNNASDSSLYSFINLRISGFFNSALPWEYALFSEYPAFIADLVAFPKFQYSQANFFCLSVKSSIYPPPFLYLLQTHHPSSRLNILLAS